MTSEQYRTYLTESIKTGAQMMHVIHDCIEVQKKTGIILLPSYLDAQIVPDDIEIKLVDKNERRIKNEDYTHNG